MIYRLSDESQPLVYRDRHPAPGTDVHRGRTDEGAFVFALHTVAGEIDAKLLLALQEYTASVNEQRGRGAPPLRLVVDEDDAAD